MAGSSDIIVLSLLYYDKTITMALGGPQHHGSTPKGTPINFSPNRSGVGKKNYGTFAPKNFRSRERKYHGMELSLPGTFAPGSESSKNFRSHAKLLSVATFVHGNVGI